MLANASCLVRREVAATWGAGMLVAAGDQRHRAQEARLAVTKPPDAAPKRSDVAHLSVAHPRDEIKRHVELLGIEAPLEIAGQILVFCLCTWLF